MLTSLSIRKIVLVDRLDLSFESGLCVLTGETGAGKSILLVALGLAIGARADQRLLQAGAERASVTAGFILAPDHPSLALLDQQGIGLDDGHLLLRRVLETDGRSRAFINDQAVSIGLLRSVGDSLIEIQGQFDERGLLDPTTHRETLDAFAGLTDQATRVAEGWSAWQESAEALTRAQTAQQKASQDEEYLRHSLDELNALDPQPGEEQTLTEQRSYLAHGEKLVEAVTAALAELSGDAGKPGVESGLGAAQRILEREAEKTGSRLTPVLEALERAAAETADVLAQLQALGGGVELDPRRLEEVEERYFALKDLARKHRVAVDDLAAFRDSLAARLEAIEDGGAELAELAARADAARRAYGAAAGDLSAARQSAAKTLDRAVNAELPALKLEKARFTSQLETLEEARWGAHGQDRITFQVVTVPGAPPGPLGRIASGGELSRFLLALKVVLAQDRLAKSLVFDEVDSAIGGATAHAVGERLERLARDRQVLVVTHSPQVAARGTHHWCVRKEASSGKDGERVTTQVGQLSARARREELARMLSGATVTDEARAAADRLLGAA